jgi:hypothetical protein
MDGWGRAHASSRLVILGGDLQLLKDMEDGAIRVHPMT